MITSTTVPSTIGCTSIRLLITIATIIIAISISNDGTTSTTSYTTAATEIEGQRPNIILFLADNLGYADISWLQQHHQSFSTTTTKNEDAAVTHNNNTTTTTTTTTTSSKTWNIDSIGQNGRTFQNWNSMAHLCSASRASILTGNYPARLGIYPGTFQPDAIYGLRQQVESSNHHHHQNTNTNDDDDKNKKSFKDRHHSSITLASLLKKYSRQNSDNPTTHHPLRRSQKQYVTAMIGKWHLGHTISHLPTNHGFDTYIGIPYHMSGGSIDDHICTYDDDSDDSDDIDSDDMPMKPKQWLPLYKNTTIVQQPVNVHTLAQTYVKEATSFIQQQIQTDTPYFLYMAFSHVHQLCASYTHIEQTTCQWSGKHHTNNNNNNNNNNNQSPTFTDAVQEMDWMVGQILDTIRHSDPNQINNTIIVFTSDNGPWLAEQSCSGLRGPYHAQWLRDHVPQNCTACPHDYVSNPTIDHPRRCTLSRRKQQSRQQEQDTLRTAFGLQFNQYDDVNDKDEDEIVLEMDGVHCGDDSGLGSVWEANLRMPAMVQWTGTIPPNTSTMALVSSLDITPTILSLVFNQTKNQQEDDDIVFDGLDVSTVWLGREDEYNSDERVLFFWRDGFLLNLEPLGPPFGRFDVVAVKVGRIKAWYWTKSAHYNNDVEVYHYPPLLFDTISDPAEAYPIDYPYNDTSNKYSQLVHRIDYLMEEHKEDIASSLPYPLTLARDAKYIPCINRTTGCRSEPLFPDMQQGTIIDS